MKTVQIKNVSFPVSKICLGTAYFGTAQEEATAFSIMDTYMDHGGRFFNTAHEYGEGLSESTIGAWLRARRNRDQIILTTKGGEDHRLRFLRDMHRDSLLQDIDESLARLHTDYVDFYMLHLDDTAVSVAEILETMEEIVKAGKARHYGCSNWDVSRQREADAYAKAHGLQGFVIDEIQFCLARDNEQNRYLCRTLDDTYVQLHEEDGKCVGGYSPLATGCLNKFIRDGNFDNCRENYGRLFDNPYTREVGRRLAQVCKETGWSPTLVQLAWLLNPPYHFPSFLILGASRPEQLVESLSALDLTLTPEQMQYLCPSLAEFPDYNPNFIPVNEFYPGGNV